MHHSSSRPDDEIESVVEEYGDMLFRICFVMLKNKADAEDVVQETFLKYIRKNPTFATSQQKKSWLTTVAVNKCRDMLRFHHRHPQIDIDSIQVYPQQPEDRFLIEVLMSLPDKFKMVLVLYYIDQYRVDEIAKMIGKTPSAVKMRLKKGRQLLKKAYQEGNK